MTNILDTVEPAGWLWRRDYDGGGYSTELCNTEQQAEALLERFAEGGTYDSIQSLYSRETVERLLAEYRKQVLLEAAEVVSKIPVSVGYSADGAYESTSQTLWDAAEELRRMAEGEK